MTESAAGHWVGSSGGSGGAAGAYSQVVKKAFSQRRKTVRNALSDFATAQDLSALGIDPRVRPEDLALEDFVRVANAVAGRED